MDATAVAGARGLAATAVRARDALKVGALFGAAQGLMPLGGWAVGAGLGRVAAAWDHFIACALLVAIGAKMIVEALRAGPHGGGRSDDAGAFATKPLLVLALATSIDAFAAGITLPTLGAPVFVSAAVIAVVTAACSAAGVYAGRRFGDVLGKRLEVVGGVVLIGLGVKIVVEHVLAG